MTVRSAILGLIATLTLVSVPLQMLIEPSGTNVASACIIAASSFGLLAYLTWSSALATHPLSSFTLLGFCFTTLLGAQLIQTAAKTAVSASLYDPLYTFGTLAFYLALAIGTHCAYRFFSVNRTSLMSSSRQVGLLRGLLARLGVYRLPPCGALWWMGFLGLCTFMFSHQQSLVGKVAMGFSFLTWAPFLIPFVMVEVGPAYCNARLQRVFLFVYLGAAVVFGLAFNTRAIMFQGVATIGLLYVLSGLRSAAPLTGRAVFRVGLLAVVMMAISIPASQLATAMVVARQMRSKLSGMEMIATTIQVLGRPHLIEAYGAQGRSSARFEAYDEHYVENPLLNRLVNTKYVDNALHFARSITSDDSKRRLRDVSIRLVWAGLPTPVLARLGISVAKDDLTFSVGDYLAYLSRGAPLGGRRIGSMFAQGLVLFGVVFPFLCTALFAAIFGLIDLLSQRRTDGKASISVLGMLQIWTFFITGISYEGLHVALYFVFRNFWQMVLIYSAVCVAIRLTGSWNRAAPAEGAVATWQGG